jgi:hypothetical protein
MKDKNTLAGWDAIIRPQPKKTCATCTRHNNDGTCNKCEGCDGYTTEIGNNGTCVNWKGRDK